MRGRRRRRRRKVDGGGEEARAKSKKGRDEAEKGACKLFLDSATVLASKQIKKG